MADLLQWVGYALILVFFAQVIAALFPIALLQAQWIVRASAALRGTASLPLLGTVLILLANMIDGSVLPSSWQLVQFRRIATIAALGFLLLIPLQSFASVRSINSQAQERQAEVNRVIEAANQLQKATTENQLRDAIRAIPGGEQLADRPLGADVQTIKTALLRRIQPSVKRAENQLQEIKSQALQNLYVPLFRDALTNLAYAIGFGGMGYNAIGKPTPLRRLLKPRNPELLKEISGTWPGLPRMPK
ncbi:MAG: hypothetical protein VKM17_04445 [Cyanobacteriota bacterium]|nr:hypothetical protein [Cyanobacteriota bacterium]